MDNVSATPKITGQDTRPERPAEVESALPGGDWRVFSWEYSHPQMPASVFLNDVKEVVLDYFRGLRSFKWPQVIYKNVKKCSAVGRVSMGL